MILNKQDDLKFVSLNCGCWFGHSQSEMFYIYIYIYIYIYTYRIWFSTVMIYHYLNVKQDKICEQVLTWRLPFAVCVQNDHHQTSVDRRAPLSVKHVFCNLFIRIVLQQPKYNKVKHLTFPGFTGTPNISCVPTDKILADWGLEIRVANVWAIKTGLSPSIVINGICSQ